MKNIYNNPPKTPRHLAVSILASDDVFAIAETLVSIALNDSDVDWVEATCRRFVAHEDAEVRGVAVTCLGHVARIHKQISSESLALLEALREDDAIGGRAQDALEDVEIFVRGRQV